MTRRRPDGRRGDRFKEITMERGLVETGFALMLLAGSAAPSAAAAFLAQLHAPALIRFDNPRPGGMPGAARDVAAMRDVDTTGAVDPGKVRRKKPRTH
jgi:hypothetical protein